MSHRPNGTRVLGTAFVVALALTAMLAATAQAATLTPRVELNGAPLEGGEKLTAVSTTAATLSAPKAGLNLTTATGECTSGGELTTAVPTTVVEASLTCLKVGVVSAPNCWVESEGSGVEGKVVTNKLTGTVVWSESTGEKAGVLFKPASGSEFVKLVVKNGKGACAASGTYPVSNEVLGPETGCASGGFEEGTLDFPTPPTLSWFNNAVPRASQSVTQLAVKAQPAVFDTTFKVEMVEGGSVRVCGV